MSAETRSSIARERASAGCARRQKSRCRWPAPSTPIRRGWRRQPASARSISPAAGSRPIRWECPISASAPWKMCSPMFGASPMRRALPLLVDIDTGWGSAFNIARTIRSMIKAGAAAVHIEDQVGAKRCGHRPGKELVPANGNGRSHQGRGGCAHRCSNFVIMARTDALANEGLASGDRARPGLRRRGRRHDLRRSGHGVADVHAVPRGGRACRFWPTSRSSGRRRCLRAKNWRRRAWISFSTAARAYRAMNAAALKVYETIRSEGTQRDVDFAHAIASRPLSLSRLPRLRATNSMNCSCKSKS